MDTFTKESLIAIADKYNSDNSPNIILQTSTWVDDLVAKMKCDILNSAKKGAYTTAPSYSLGHGIIAKLEMDVPERVYVHAWREAVHAAAHKIEIETGVSADIISHEPFNGIWGVRFKWGNK